MSIFLECGWSAWSEVSLSLDDKGGQDNSGLIGSTMSTEDLWISMFHITAVWEETLHVQTHRQSLYGVFIHGQILATCHEIIIVTNV